MKKRYRTYASLLLLFTSFLCRSEPLVETLLTKATEAIKVDLDRAEVLIEKALEAAPDNPQVHFVCGRVMGRQAAETVFLALHYAGKSLDCLERAVALAPEDVRYRHGLLRFYLGAPGIAGGSRTLAKAQVQQIRQLDKIEGAKAELYYLAETEQRDSQLMRLAELRTEFPHEAYFHYHHGLLLQQEQQYSAASAAFYQALMPGDGDLSDYIRQLPGNMDNADIVMNALYQVGRTAVFSGEQTEQGIEALLLFSNTVQSHHDAPPVAWAHLRLAQLYALKRDKSEVESHLTLARESNDPDLHDIAAQVRKEAGAVE